MKKYITNGSSAAETVKQAFDLSEDNILPMNDLLSFGPLVKFKGIESWIKLREQYWFEIWKFCGLTPIPLSEMRRDFYINHKELVEAEEIHIWIGTALGDQIMFCFLVMFFNRMDVDFSTVYVHQVSKCKDSGVHRQNPALIKPASLSKSDEEYQLSSEQIEILLEVWEILSSDKPENYLSLIKNEIPELPYLIPSLRTFINRYPEKKSGLTIWQKSILESASNHQPNAARIVGNVLGDAVDGLDLIGDMSVFAEIKRMGLSTNEFPLLLLNNDDGKLRDTTVEITKLGREVLEGKKNIIDLIGLDDWVGGVHLTSKKTFYEIRETNAY